MVVQFSIHSGAPPVTYNIAMYNYNIIDIFVFTHYLHFAHVI